MRRGRGYASLMLSGQNKAARLEGAAYGSALRGALSRGPESIDQMHEASGVPLPTGLASISTRL